MPDVLLNLPFLGTWFVLNGGVTEKLNHHHGNKAQNFAFDFTKVNKDGKSFGGVGKNNEDYFCFGEPVLSPGDGLVIEAVDGVKDNKPGNGNYLAGAGNYIVIRHSDREYSFIAHLRQGSVSVEAGDSIGVGDQLGECGNSGTSFAPHLHYHLQDSDILVTYACDYDDSDLSKGNFPTRIDFEENAAGVEVRFSNVIANGNNKQLHSPKRGELVSNQT
jgi:peptidase M23-like protein